MIMNSVQLVVVEVDVTTIAAERADIEKVGI